MPSLAVVASHDDSGPPADDDVTPHARLRLASEQDERDRAARPTCVLLVEDDAAIRLLCRVNLEAGGFRVVAAADAKEGLELAASEHPDIVLLDVMLPDGEGFDLAEKLDAPVVFLSARTSQLDLERGRKAGALDYVTKPFDPVGLPARLREDLEELGRSGNVERVWRMRFGRE